MGHVGDMAFFARAKKNKKKNLSTGHVGDTAFLPAIRKHAYSNIQIISPPNTENFEIKNCVIFSYFCSKHRLWVFVRTASARRF